MSESTLRERDGEATDGGGEDEIEVSGEELRADDSDERPGLYKAVGDGLRGGDCVGGGKTTKAVSDLEIGETISGEGLRSKLVEDVEVVKVVGVVEMISDVARTSEEEEREGIETF